MNKQWSNRSLVIVILAGALVVLCFVLSRPKRLTAKLANGTELSVLGVTHGVSNNFFLPGGILERLIYTFVPAKGIKFGPVKIVPESPIVDYWTKQDGSVMFSNHMTVWIGHGGRPNAPLLPIPPPKWPSDIRATLADETGEEWDMSSGIGRVRSRIGHGLNGITAWPFMSCPRRGKTLRFRMYARNGLDQWDTLADFTLPNPAPGPYPTWKSTNLPATQKSGDLEVSLINLVSGIKPASYGLGDRPFTTATFEVKENGQPTEAWLPDWMEASDATGNESMFMTVNYGATNGLATYDIQGTSLSPSEVWRLRMRFAKDRDAKGTRMWTSPELPVRTNGYLDTLNLTTNLEFLRINVSCAKTREGNTITLKMDPPQKNARMQRPEIVDDRGQTATYVSGGFEDFGFDAQWKIPDGARWIKITTGLDKTQEFEFVAQPTVTVRDKR